MGFHGTAVRQIYPAVSNSLSIGVLSSDQGGHALTSHPAPLQTQQPVASTRRRLNRRAVPVMDASARVYTPFNLRAYDFVVLTVSNNWIWRCPTRAVQLSLFQQHLGESAHLDIGVGTGYYPANSVPALAKTKSITLLDLNPTALDFAEARLRTAGYTGNIEKMQQNIFEALPEEVHGRFDSISSFYLLHCLPGSFPEKGEKVFARLAAALAPGGVYYGTTILGRGVQHNLAGKFLLWLYNRKGIFGNKEDSLESLEQALRSNFEDVNLRLIGVVAVWEARKPIRK